MREIEWIPCRELQGFSDFLYKLVVDNIIEIYGTDLKTKKCICYHLDDIENKFQINE